MNFGTTIKKGGLEQAMDAHGQVGGAEAAKEDFETGNAEIPKEGVIPIPGQRA